MKGGAGGRSGRTGPRPFGARGMWGARSSGWRRICSGRLWATRVLCSFSHGGGGIDFWSAGVPAIPARLAGAPTFGRRLAPSPSAGTTACVGRRRVLARHAPPGAAMRYSPIRWRLWFFRDGRLQSPWRKGKVGGLRRLGMAGGSSVKFAWWSVMGSDNGGRAGPPTFGQTRPHKPRGWNTGAPCGI